MPSLPTGASHHLKARRGAAARPRSHRKMSSLRAYGPPTPPRSLQATPLAGIPGPRFPTYWPRAGWSRKSFWERKGRKTPPPIPDPDGRGRARGTERKRAPPGARRDPAPAATLRRRAPGIISDSPLEPSGCSRSARTPEGSPPPPRVPASQADAACVPGPAARAPLLPGDGSA